MALIKEHTLGEVRYITHFVQFPVDDPIFPRSLWIRQIPFVGPVSFEMKRRKWPSKEASEILKKGETWFKDDKGREHRFKVEDFKRHETWGKQSENVSDFYNYKGERGQ